ncbi:hypothetical protein KY330_04790 [Candidatus Woesearchaeota archaeon]|nr:hypothetical protein [Candidatus Woesearchaeota archaeon]
MTAINSSIIYEIDDFRKKGSALVRKRGSKDSCTIDSILLDEHGATFSRVSREGQSEEIENFSFRVSYKQLMERGLLKYQYGRSYNNAAVTYSLSIDDTNIEKLLERAKACKEQ